MGNLRSAKKRLNEKNVWIAQEMRNKQIELAQKFVEERVKKDAEFARDVLKAVGDNLPPKIKSLAEETIAKEASAKIGEENYQKAIGTIAENLAAEIDSDFLASDAVKVAIKDCENKDIALDDPPVWALKNS